MANSKFEYTRLFESSTNATLLPNTWIVVRIDGRSFHRLSTYYRFSKPNDARAINLANAAATAVLRSIQDIVFAYGQSDEYSFVFDRSTALFERRESKLVSTVVSCFTAHYVFLWPQYFSSSSPSPNASARATTTAAADEPQPEAADQASVSLRGHDLPTFDGRAVCYPSTRNLRDYLSWRQADCHINNLYNTTFWALVQQGGMTNAAAEEELKGSFAADKHEILFSRFGLNYNNEPDMFKKGNVVYRDYGVLDQASTAAGGVEVDEGQGEGPVQVSKTQQEKEKKRRAKAVIRIEHVDIIKDEFWARRPWILRAPGHG